MEIIVRKNGRITIPVSLRKNTKEKGTLLEVSDTKDGVLLKPKTIWDMVGSFSEVASVEEMNKLLDKLRHEPDE